MLPDLLPRTVTIEGGEVVIRLRPLRVALALAAVRQDTFRIRVEHSDKWVSYQSVMAAASLPERLEAIGDEWLYLTLEKLDFPVDACVHFEILSPQRAREIDCLPAQEGHHGPRRGVRTGRAMSRGTSMIGWRMRKHWKTN
ncbi:hypothetical protein [Alicyclobacillus contaminans]|uniref:hypothetical protein n=1 Tax=Alicyclobacillus contaminans TaxID=392016 RepID=UPI0004229AC2|nr:hypothetical protein [Alicyclobacillus contaminans]